MQYPTLPLADVPGFRPDRPVRAIHDGMVGTVCDDAGGGEVVFCPDDGPRVVVPLASLTLLCDPSGCRSLAVAIGAALGLDVSSGCWIGFDSQGDFFLEPLDDVRKWFTMYAGRALDEIVVPALSTIDPTAEHARALALAAVARVVLGVSRG